MTDPLRVGFVPASRTIFNQDLAVDVRGGFIDAISEAGMEPVVPGPGLTENGLVQTPVEAAGAARLFADRDVAGVIIGALNFGNEVPAAMAALGAGEHPIMIFGVGEERELDRETGRRDSFCGLISIATALRHRRARFVFPSRATGFPGGAELAGALSDFACVCRVLRGVRGAVYGQLGPRPADFETCAYDELSLLDKFGIRVVPIPLSTVFGMARSVPVALEREISSEMSGEVDTGALTPEDMGKIARLQAALDDLVEEEGLDGLAVQCWTSMQEDYGVSPCYVMSRLTSRGVPSACEADVHGTLSMHALSLAGGSDAGLADWNNRHWREQNVFSAWHCGVFPASLAAKGTAELSYHNILAEATGGREGKYGTVESRIAEGPVTMARVTEHADGSWPVLIAEGKVVDAPGDPPGGHGWVEVSDLDRLYAELLRGFPHHTAIVRGRIASRLAAAAYFLGLETVIPLDIEPGHLEIGPNY